MNLKPRTTQPREPIDRVILLGHSGFIGAEIARQLNESAPAVSVVGHSLGTLDLTCPADVERLAPDCRSGTAFVICAGIKRQLGDSLETFEQNLAIARNLCRLFERHTPGRVIFFSSTAVYGEEIDSLAISEQTSVHPTSWYGIAKYSSERLLARTLLPNSAASLLVVRPPLVYGPGDRGGFYGPSGFCQKALSGEPITLWGDGSELREFVFVGDVARVVVTSLFRSESFVLNVVSGTSCSYRDIIAEIERQTARRLIVQIRPRSRPRVDHQFLPGRVRSIFPEIRFHTLAEGVERTLASLPCLARAA
jgi:UDP-glucose 4-epimerase